MDKNTKADGLPGDAHHGNAAENTGAQEGFRARNEEQSGIPPAGRRTGNRLNPELLRSAGDSISEKYPHRSPVNVVKESAEDSDEQAGIDTASVASTLMNAKKKPPIVQRLIDNAQQTYQNNGQPSTPAYTATPQSAPAQPARMSTGDPNARAAAPYGAQPHAPIHTAPAQSAPAQPARMSTGDPNARAAAPYGAQPHAPIHTAPAQSARAGAGTPGFTAPARQQTPASLHKLLEEQFVAAANTDSARKPGGAPKPDGEKTPIYTPDMVKNAAPQPGSLDIKIGDEIRRGESAEDIFHKALTDAQGSAATPAAMPRTQMRRDVLPGSIIKDAGTLPKAPSKSFDPSNILVSRNSPGKTISRGPLYEKPDPSGADTMDKTEELFRLSTASSGYSAMPDSKAYPYMTSQFGYAAAGDGRESIDIENTRRILEELRKINSESEVKGAQDKAEAKKKRKLFWGIRPAYVALVAVAGIAIGVAANAFMNGVFTTPGIPSTESSPVSAASSKVLTHSARYDIQQVFTDIVIKNPDLTLKNVVIENSLIIDKNVGDGDVYLEDVVIKGALHVKGGGPNSIHLKNVIVSEVLITKEGSPVRLVAEGASNITNVDTIYPAILVNTDVSEGFSGFRKVSVSAGGSMDGSLELIGVELEQLVVDTPSIIRFSQDAQVKSVIQSENASFYHGKIGSLTITTRQKTRTVASGLDSTAVDNITIDTPAVLNLSGATLISNLTASKHVDINGRGSVGNLAIDSHSAVERITLNLKAMDVSNLYVASPAILRMDEQSYLSGIMAKSSLYITGKGKIYSLIAAADDIQYEIKPDVVLVMENTTEPYAMFPSQIDDPVGVEEPAPGASGNSSDAAPAVSEGTSAFTKGKGTKEEPFEVSTPAQLNAVRSNLRAHYLQTADINMADSSELANNFTPIAPDSSHIFTGTYNGGGYKIKNLNIESSGSNVGLFGYVSGEIRNLGIGEGSRITSTSESTVYVGAIAGVMYKSAKVQGCYSLATVSAVSQNGYVGGLVGYSYSGSVSESYHLGSVKGAGSVGGIIGMNHTSASLTDCYNAGAVSGTGDVGSIAGYNYSSVIKNSYYLTGSAAAGIGKGTGDAFARSAEEMKTKKLADDLNAGSSVWMQATGTFPYPQLKSNMQER